MAGIGRVLFQTFRAVLEPRLFPSLSSFCTGPFLPAWISIPLSFYRYTQWCMTGWGQGRWRGNLLSTPYSPPSTAPCAASSIVPVFDLWKQGCSKLLRENLCMNMQSRTSLSSDLLFGFTWHVNLSKTLMGCSAPMLLSRITSVLVIVLLARGSIQQPYRNNHSLIIQLHQTWQMEENPLVLCIKFAKQLPQWVKQE